MEHDNMPQLLIYDGNCSGFPESNVGLMDAFSSNVFKDGPPSLLSQSMSTVPDSHVSDVKQDILNPKRVKIDLIHPNR